MDIESFKKSVWEHYHDTYIQIFTPSPKRIFLAYDKKPCESLILWVVVKILT